MRACARRRIASSLSSTTTISSIRNIWPRLPPRPRDHARRLVQRRRLGVSGENGSYETHSRLRLFAQDYDRELLLLDNYIPLPALLLERGDVPRARRVRRRIRPLRGLGFPDPPFAARAFPARAADHLRSASLRRRIVRGAGRAEGSPSFRAREAAGLAETLRPHRQRRLFASVLERQKRRSGDALCASSSKQEGRSRIEPERRGSNATSHTDARCNVPGTDQRL